MSLWKRMLFIRRFKEAVEVHQTEDVRSIMEMSLEEQNKVLYDVRAGVADLVIARKQLEKRRNQMNVDITALDEQAAQSVKNKRDDLATQALERKVLLEANRDDLQEKIDGISKRQTTVLTQVNTLESKIEQFKINKAILQAEYTAADANEKIATAFTGLSPDLQNIGISMQRARDVVEEKTARSEAVDELIKQGVLTDLTGTDTPDRLTRELAAIEQGNRIQNELMILKQKELSA